jgi:hypothetical protein
MSVYLNPAKTTEGDVLSGGIEKLKAYAKKVWRISGSSNPRIHLLYRFCPPRLLEIENELISAADNSIQIPRS